MLVSVLYPILAIFLFYEIQKSAKYASKALSERSSKERHRTGHMILTMTVFYVIASAPAGVSDFVQIFVKIDSFSIFGIFLGYGTIFISALFCLNATSHGIINFTMSTKYQDTVKRVLGLKKKKKVEEGVISVFTVAKGDFGIEFYFLQGTMAHT
uniref:G_PROTEIN_RECEP_F1_2 domain-containing protein n=1 Tax=Caenorhabditis tropicalis TaxID=1561998 RepID=A0A1I7V2H4_9PELO